MGTCTSVQANPHSRIIDKELKKEKKALTKRYKFILLGAGGVGKSTIFKQLKLLHNGGFTKTERFTARLIIHDNIIANLEKLVLAASSNGLKLNLIKITESLQRMKRRGKLNAAKLTALWESAHIMLMWNHYVSPKEYNNLDYFMSRIGEISSPEYIPNNDDILHLRHATTGILEQTFEHDKKTFNVVDIGGDRSERKKWELVFHEVDVVIFIIDLMDVDSAKQAESVLLFSKLTQESLLQNSHWVLFLNKVDLFSNKFTSEKKKNEAIRKIENEYKKTFASKNSSLYTFVTCAVDTEYVDKVIKSVEDRVIVSGLTSMMM